MEGLSKRCADINQEVPQLLGVSKVRTEDKQLAACIAHGSIRRQAILENVIFVHQDESNWRAPCALWRVPARG